MKTSELKLNDKNPRKISKDKLEKLKQSIKDFEIMMAARPIVIDSNNIILGGNMRFTALKALGYKEIPDNWVYKMEDLTDKQKKEFIIKDNVGFGEWDWDILKFDFDEADLINWGLEFPVDMIEEQQDITDYSDKNKEIDVDDLDGIMTIKLNYTEDEYWEVKEKLLKIAQTPEQAVWKLLGND